jgi:molybdopterin synthase sulfur carrier subunit
LSVVVSVPAALRQFTHDNLEVGLDASTVEELILKLDDLFPGLKTFILDENRSLRRFVNIFVNNDNIRSGVGLMTELKDGDHVQIIPAVAGG